MPSYRDRRGRFTTRSIFDQLFGAPPEVQSDFDAAPEETAAIYDADPNWYTHPGTRENTEVWTTEGEEDEDGNPIPMDPDALDASSPPSWASRYQIRFLVPQNPSYPRGLASYTPLSITEWPPSPDWGTHIGGSIGIGAIVFSRY